jgi:hypothetical protein
MTEFGLLSVLVAFGGGMFGAALGGLNAFILCGLAAVIGSAIALLGGGQAFNLAVTWGPFLGPHVAFAGGVAATAFAARKGLSACGRDTASALFGLHSTSILVVGGIFGALGYAVKAVLDFVPSFQGIPWVNSIAASIILSGAAVRLVFGRTRIFEWPRRRSASEAVGVKKAASPSPMQFLLLGIAVGLPSAAIAKALPGSTGLMLGLGAIALVFIRFDAKVPVVLHIAWSAEYAVLITGNILQGVLMGIVTVFLAEILGDFILARADTHIDPPAFAIALTFPVYPAAAVLGAAPGSLILTAALAVLAAGGFAGLSALRRSGPSI